MLVFDKTDSQHCTQNDCQGRTHTFTIHLPTTHYAFTALQKALSMRPQEREGFTQNLPQSGLMSGGGGKKKNKAKAIIVSFATGFIQTYKQTPPLPPPPLAVPFCTVYFSPPPPPVPSCWICWYPFCSLIFCHPFQFPSHPHPIPTADR